MKKNSLLCILQQSGKMYWLGIEVVCNAYLALIAIGISRIARQVIDSQISMEQIGKQMMLLVVGGLSGVIVNLILSYGNQMFVIDLSSKLRENTYDRILHCQYAYIEQEHSATIINKLTNDVAQVSEYIAYQLPEGMTAVISFSFVFCYLFCLNWIMTLTCAVCIPLALWMTKKFASPTYEAMDSFYEEMDGLADYAKDTLVEAKVERAYQLTGIRREDFNHRMDEATKLYISFEKIMAKAGAYKYILRYIPTILCIMVGFLAAHYGMLSKGAFVAFILLINKLTDPLSKSIGYVTDYKEAQVSMDRVNELLQLQDERVMPFMMKQIVSNIALIKKKEEFNTDCLNKQENSEIHCLNKQDNGISFDNNENSSACFVFENITFAYNNQTVLSNLNGMIEKGKFTAIVGKSGSGKSTLFKLLIGLYQPQTGYIGLHIDGCKIKTCDDLREHMAIVEQNSFLFQQTIAENIAAGKVNVSMEEIMKAAKLAYAHDFIMELPQGYQTVLNEGGYNLSGGQRQRIAIARAFCKDAPILLMDEMTSALDQESEQLIQRALEEYRRNRTVVVIAHRLSTIMQAENILVLEDGQFVESGTHEELLNKQGAYAGLYQSYREEMKS